MSELLNIEVTGDVKPDLPDIPMTPELQKAMDADPMQEGVNDQASIQIVSTDEIRRFLKAFYEVHGLMIDKAIWTQTDEWFGEVAEAITPDINKLCARMPAVGHAIKAVNTAGGWARLGFDYAIRCYLSWQKRQKAKADAQGGNDGGEKRTTESAGVESRREPIIDYRPTPGPAPEPPAVERFGSITVPEPVVQPATGKSEIRIDYRPAGSV